MRQSFLAFLAPACLAAACLGAACLLAPTGARAAPVDCGNGTALVQGDDTDAVLGGVCRSLTIQGNGNTLRADLAPGATVTVRGNGNRIGYRLVGGITEAHVDVQGRGDVVGPYAAPVAGTGAPASQGALILPAPGAAECRDRDVTVTARGSFSLNGGCRSLTVQASGATVQAEMQPGSRIDIQGDRSRVTWFVNLTGPDPVIAISGQGSFADKMQRLGSTIAPPDLTAGDLQGQAPLVVTAGQAEAACQGRDAQVAGDNASYVLHGPCRSLTVNGSNDKVIAELAPGSRIAISGDNDVVQFALTAAGPDPIVSVAGSHSNAWRIQRLGAASRADASRGVTPTAQGMRVQGGAGASVEEVPAVPADQHPQ